ncbi:uncharacterized protein PG998_005980 [Apiospora kogelbergensis]|uniref:Uncharacterized protein n=1 Tax=Apiospora kogelbergensis TaxID=1337665 RepID=A0AAW0R459_9PEZI
MGRGGYETSGTPKPEPQPKPKTNPVIISTGDDKNNSGSEVYTSCSCTNRFAVLVNCSRLDEAAATEDGLVDLGRGGYDITNSPKPAPKPVEQPKPEKPKN